MILTIFVIYPHVLRRLMNLISIGRVVCKIMSATNSKSFRFVIDSISKCCTILTIMVFICIMAYFWPKKQLILFCIQIMVFMCIGKCYQYNCEDQNYMANRQSDAALPCSRVEIVPVWIFLDRRMHWDHDANQIGS